MDPVVNLLSIVKYSRLNSVERRNTAQRRHFSGCTQPLDANRRRLLAPDNKSLLNLHFHMTTLYPFLRIDSLLLEY